MAMASSHRIFYIDQLLFRASSSERHSSDRCSFSITGSYSYIQLSCVMTTSQNAAQLYCKVVCYGKNYFYFKIKLSRIHYTVGMQKVHIYFIITSRTIKGKWTEIYFKAGKSNRMEIRSIISSLLSMLKTVKYDCIASWQINC